MGAKGRQVPVLTPSRGRKYIDKKTCLADYLDGVEFVFNYKGHKLDGSEVTIINTYYNVVRFRIGSKTFIYEGN